MMVRAVKISRIFIFRIVATVSINELKLSRQGISIVSYSAFLGHVCIPRDTDFISSSSSVVDLIIEIQMSNAKCSYENMKFLNNHVNCSVMVARNFKLCSYRTNTTGFDKC